MNVNESILTTIKKLRGLSESDTSFDQDIIVAINSCFHRLHQLGVGPSSIFSITTAAETWSDFFGETTVLPMVVSYMAQYVQREFDPPSGGTLDSLDRQIDKAEWLLNVDVDPTETEKEYMNLLPLWGEEDDDE